MMRCQNHDSPHKLTRGAYGETSSDSSSLAPKISIQPKAFAESKDGMQKLTIEAQIGSETKCYQLATIYDRYNW
jgi:hypothetical protein